MQIRFEKGNKGANPDADQKIYVRGERCTCSNGWELWGYEDQLSTIIELFAKNEDDIYPRKWGYLGRKLLKWYINRVLDDGRDLANQKLQQRKEASQHNQAYLFDRMEEEGLHA